MQTYFIGGHLDVTVDEFQRHYAARILVAALLGGRFVVGDAPGCDELAIVYLTRIGLADRLTVYHMHDRPRVETGTVALKGGYWSDGARDRAAFNDSTADIMWVRPGRETSSTANNIKRRQRGSSQAHH